MGDEKLYTCIEVAEKYRVALATVWEWVREGKLSALKVGKSYRIRESDLAKFIEEKN